MRMQHRPGGCQHVAQIWLLHYHGSSIKRHIIIRCLQVYLGTDPESMEELTYYWQDVLEKADTDGDGAIGAQRQRVHVLLPLLHCVAQMMEDVH